MIILVELLKSKNLGELKKKHIKQLVLSKNSFKNLPLKIAEKLQNLLFHLQKKVHSMNISREHLMK